MLVKWEAPREPSSRLTAAHADGFRGTLGLVLFGVPYLKFGALALILLSKDFLSCWGA